MLGILLWNEVGGWETIQKRTPAGFFRFVPQSTGKDWLAYIAAWITIGLGSIPQQDVFQRVMAAKTEKTAVRASFLASGMYLTIALIPLFIALSAKLLHPDLPKDNQLIIPNMVMRHGSFAVADTIFWSRHIGYFKRIEWGDSGSGNGFRRERHEVFPARCQR